MHAYIHNCLKINKRGHPPCTVLGRPVALTTVTPFSLSREETINMTLNITGHISVCHIQVISGTQMNLKRWQHEKKQTCTIQSTERRRVFLEIQPLIRDELRTHQIQVHTLRKAVSHPTPTLSLSVDDNLELERPGSRSQSPGLLALWALRYSFPSGTDIFPKHHPFMMLFQIQWFSDSSCYQVKPTFLPLLTHQGPAWSQSPPPASTSPHALPTLCFPRPSPQPPVQNAALIVHSYLSFRTTQMAPLERAGPWAPSATLSCASLSKFHSGTYYLGLQTFIFPYAFQPSART